MSAREPPATALSVEPLTPEGVGAAAATLAAAFHDDPLSLWLLPEEEARRRWLRLSMAASLRLILPEGHVFTVGHGGVAGAVGWVPPGRYPLPAGRSLRSLAGLLARVPGGGLSPRGGIRSLRLMWLFERLHPRERHWYLYVLGVDPSRQGTGLGRALLDPVLARADAGGIPAYTETSRERNVSFYGHFGFRVVREVGAPGGGPPVWTLLRPPAT